MAAHLDSNTDPKQNRHRQDHFVRLVAGTIAIAITVIYPLAFALVSYLDAIDLRRFQAELTARQIARYAYVQGPTWRFSEARVAELVHEIAPSEDDPGRQVVIPTEGDDRIVIGEPPAPPVARADVPIVVGTKTVGWVTVEASLLPLIFKVALSLVLVGAMAATAYGCVLFALRWLRSADEALIRSETELSVQYAKSNEAKAKIAELSADLAQASRVTVLGEMATSFAHELNQPLAAIANYAAGSRKRLAWGENLTGMLPDILQRIEEEAHRAGAVISGIRHFVGRREGTARAFDFHAVARDVERLVAAKLVEHDTRLTLAMDTREASPIEGNRVQIQQVLVNLILNAVEAMAEAESEDRRIRVRLLKTGQDMEVRVDDNGPGLDDVNNANLFRPFFTTKESGMGMGLAICRTIIIQHGGTIRAEKSPLGGAAFVFTLPLRPTPPVQALAAD